MTEEAELDSTQSLIEVIRSLIHEYRIPLSDIFPEAAEDLKVLEALRRNGVDNWEFFEDAIESIDG